MGSIAADPSLPKSRDLRTQIIADIKRHTEDGTHSRADNFRVEDVHCAAAHHDAGRARGLSGPEDSSQVSRVLNVLQNKQQRRIPVSGCRISSGIECRNCRRIDCRIVCRNCRRIGCGTMCRIRCRPCQHLFTAVDRHFRDTQDSLGRRSLSSLCHHLFRDNRHRMLFQDPVFFFRCAVHTVFRHIYFFDILRRCIRTEPYALDHKQSCLPAQLCFLLQFDQPPDPRIRSGSNNIRHSIPFL